MGSISAVIFARSHLDTTTSLALEDSLDSRILEHYSASTSARATLMSLFASRPSSLSASSFIRASARLRRCRQSPVQDAMLAKFAPGIRLVEKRLNPNTRYLGAVSSACDQHFVRHRVWRVNSSTFGPPLAPAARRPPPPIHEQIILAISPLSRGQTAVRGRRIRPLSTQTVGQARAILGALKAGCGWSPGSTCGGSATNMGLAHIATGSVPPLHVHFAFTSRSHSPSVGCLFARPRRIPGLPRVQSSSASQYYACPDDFVFWTLDGNRYSSVPRDVTSNGDPRYRAAAHISHCLARHRVYPAWGHTSIPPFLRLPVHGHKQTIRCLLAPLSARPRGIFCLPRRPGFRNKGSRTSSLRFGTLPASANARWLVQKGRSSRFLSLLPVLEIRATAFAESRLPL
ncbi:hypothetical protein B0H17DRAFT_1200628 [Mycena rosella]|uniref:Uncharacterized protein n=1 Tax=Mycena rosella TaxID=1033263 RepID=A0AAD7GFJ7_MYCRO|nr:hypothetical protein B0H17DRAFT_1200628 [Mycena rosella]